MKILLFFHGGSTNRGCEAIVRSGVAMIKNHYPEVTTIDLVSRDPKTDEIIPLLDSIYIDKIRPIKKYSFDWLRSVINFKLFKDERIAFQIKHSDIISKIPHYDVFLSIGGDNYCYGEQPGIYEIDRCIKKAGKKLVLWGASIGEEDLSPPKIEDLKLFDLILARESITKTILENNGITSVQLCADGAFTMEKEELSLPEGWQEGNTIGFNFSPLVWKKNKDSKDAALKLVKHILATTDMTIALTPHVMIVGNNDYEVLEQFYHEFKSTNRVILLPDNLNAIQYKGYIARMRFFIGARTHATIAAYSNCVPTMVLGYSVKSKGIAKDIFGYERLVLALDEISDADQLIQKFNELLKDENELKAILNQKIPYIKEMALKAVDYLRKV
jgi:colanic acid/amylovoran biosynthesis protein